MSVKVKVSDIDGSGWAIEDSTTADDVNEDAFERVWTSWLDKVGYLHSKFLSTQLSHAGRFSWHYTTSQGVLVVVDRQDSAEP